MASGIPEAAICVQDIDVQCVLQFTLLHAAGCALHRLTSRVIHRSELYSFSLVCHRHCASASRVKRASASTVHTTVVRRKIRKVRLRAGRRNYERPFFKPSPQTPDRVVRCSVRPIDKSDQVPRSKPSTSFVRSSVDGSFGSRRPDATRCPDRLSRSSLSRRRRGQTDAIR